VFFARYEASQFGSRQIEPEHLLLGLMREEHGLGPGLSRDIRTKIRKDLESQIPHAEQFSTSIDVPLSKACKQLFESAKKEAAISDSRDITPAHFLLAILRSDESLAAVVLAGHGLHYDTFRETVRCLAPAERDQPTSSSSRLQQLVDGTVEHLKFTDTYGDEILKRREWSRKQALGHLVDWACAHQQWIALALNDLSVQMSGSYPAEDWMDSQGYATFSWSSLIDLWVSLNHLIAHLVARIPPDKLTTQCRIGVAAPVTLSQLIEHYIEHVETIVGEILTRPS
jgi:hypothetical protein